MSAASAGCANRRVDLIFFDAGGGHRASTMALAAVANGMRRSWHANPVNLRDLLGSIDFIHNTVGVRFEDFYNGLLKRGITAGTGAMLRFSQMLIALKRRREVELLARHWQAQPPELVISLIPNFNRAIFEGLRTADRAAGRQPTTLVTVLTDFADYPPHFWIERQEQYFICGSARAVDQALEAGHPPQRIFRTSGMIVRPEFYRSTELSRDYERRKLGLKADLPTGLVMFGGFGSRRMIAIARRVAAARLKTQLIFMCGHNQPLKRRLSAMRLPYPHRVEGFTREPHYFMRLADYFIGKPGPGSLSEAWVMELPAIVERNAWTMVQERYNTDLVREQGLGVVLESFAEIAEGITPMLDPATLAGYRARVTALNNRAVFEIPAIVDTLIGERRNPAEYPWVSIGADA
jgi:hypothetical protein